MIKFSAKFKISTPPSVNHYLGNKISNGRLVRFPSGYTKQWKQEFYKHLMINRLFLNEIRDNFDIKKNHLAVKYEFYFPKKELLNKDGSIKRRRNDLCNLFKTPNDVLCEYLNIDDALIGTLMGRKKISLDNDNYLGLTILLIENNFLPSDLDRSKPI